MGDKPYEVLGFAAAFLTTVAFLPQAYTVWKTGDTKGLSLFSYVTYSWGLFFWLIFALLTGARPTIISSAFSLVVALFLAVTIHRNNKRNKEIALKVRGARSG